MKKSELKDLIMECMCEVAEDDEVYEEGFIRARDLQTINRHSGHKNYNPIALGSKHSELLYSDLRDLKGNINKLKLQDAETAALDEKYLTGDKKFLNMTKSGTPVHYDISLKEMIESYILQRMVETNCTKYDATKDLEKLVGKIAKKFKVDIRGNMPGYPMYNQLVKQKLENIDKEKDDRREAKYKRKQAIREAKRASY